MNDYLMYMLTLYFSVIITGILILAALAHMAYQKRDPPSMIAWILAISLLPYLAVPFYFLLRSRKLSRKPKSPIQLACEGEVSIENASHIDMVLRGNGIAGGMNLSLNYLGPVPMNDRWQDILFSIHSCKRIAME